MMIRRKMMITRAWITKKMATKMTIKKRKKGIMQMKTRHLKRNSRSKMNFKSNWKMSWAVTLKRQSRRQVSLKS